MSIAESLKAAAEEVVQEQDLTESQENPSGQPVESSTDYIYDAQTGFYYHPTTGYYWDPVRSAFLLREKIKTKINKKLKGFRTYHHSVLIITMISAYIMAVLFWLKFRVSQ